MAERAGEEFDGRYDDPLSNPCPECGDFDCVYWTDEAAGRAECRECGATLEEVFFTGGLYDPPLPGVDTT
jgi:hypothetical protein